MRFSCFVQMMMITMTPNNRLILLTCLAAACVNRAAAFSATSHRPPPSTFTSTSLSVSSTAPEPNERSDNNPSTKFGSPLSDSVKEANRFAVGEKREEYIEYYHSSAIIIFFLFNDIISDFICSCIWITFYYSYITLQAFSSLLYLIHSLQIVISPVFTLWKQSLVFHTSPTCRCCISMKRWGGGEGPNISNSISLKVGSKWTISIAFSLIWFFWSY